MCKCPRCQHDSFDSGKCSKCGLKMGCSNWEAAGAVLGAVYQNARYWITEAVKGGHKHDAVCAKRYGANVPYIRANTQTVISPTRVASALEWLRINGYVIVSKGRYWPAGYMRAMR